MKYNEIIKCLERDLKNQTKHTYRDIGQSKEFIKDLKEAKKRKLDFFIDPILPVDLISVEKKVKRDDETSKSKTFYYYELFWILSKDFDLEDTKKQLPFYQFYLSRITKTDGVKVILVAERGIKINVLTTFIEEYGFGLWILEYKGETITIDKTKEAKSYRSFMKDVFIDPVDGSMIKFDKQILNKADDIILFFDYFVRTAIEAMSSPISLTVKKRVINRFIIDQVFDLKNISYASTLQELVSKHLTTKNDDYDFVFDTFNTLWKVIGINIDYSEFLKTSDPILLNIFADIPYKRHYRDHYLHQFQVFLVGLTIIDKNYEIFKIGEEQLFEKQWLITASFHDMAYPIQLYDDWADKFFNNVLGIPNLGESDISRHFIDRSLLTSTGDIISLLCRQNLKSEELKGNWLREKKDLIRFFYEKITKVKHHCVISSIYLLKEAEKLKDNQLLQKIFIPSALSIALHHEVTWSDLREKFGLQYIKFCDDKLTFLLLFCDAIQEWGRPQSSSTLDKQNNFESFYLEKFIVEKNKCLVTLKSDNFEADNKIFEDKENELKNLKKFLLCQKDFVFQITIKDKHNDKREFSILNN